MAKKDKENKDIIDNESSENEEDIVVSEDIDLEAVDLEDNTVDSGEESVIDVGDIPIEEFIKDPERLSKFTDEADVEEAIYWCPQCTDNTLFIDKVCTVCGHSKNSRKKGKDDEVEESKGAELVLNPAEEGLEDYDMTGYEEEGSGNYD